MVFVHGSGNRLAKGDKLLPRGDTYRQEYADRDYYRILEKYRPSDKLAHHDAVFVCAEIEDVDNCGGYTDTIALVMPLNIDTLSRHDQAWVSEIVALLDITEDEEHPSIIHSCQQYWSGSPATPHPTWEYLCDGASVLDVSYEFDLDMESKEDEFERLLGATRYWYEHKDDPLDYVDPMNLNRELG